MPPTRYKGNRKKQREFLAAYVASGNLRQAARDTGIDIDNHYRWFAMDATYRSMYEIACDAALEVARGKCETATAMLEEEAWRRVFVGQPRKRFYKGAPIIDPATGKQYVEFEKSDRLLERLLEANCPEKYRNALQVIQQTGVQVQQVAGDVSAMAATIPAPAEAVQAALRARIIDERQKPGGNGNGSANHTEGENREKDG